MTRGYLFLEDQDFQKAYEYFDKCLDLVPTEDRAYIGLLLVKLRMPKEEFLIYAEQDLSQYHEFEKALRFAPEQRREKYNGYQRQIQVRAQEQALRQQEYAKRQWEEQERQRQAWQWQQEEFARQQREWEEMQRQKQAAWEEEQRRRQEEARARRAIFQKRAKKIAAIAAPFIVLLLLYPPVIKPGIQSYQAGSLISQGQYLEGINIYNGLKSSFWYNEAKVNEIKYEYGVRLLAEERFSMAEMMFKQVHPYQNTEAYLAQCSIGLIPEDLKSRQYGSAINRVLEIPAEDPQFVQMANLVVEYLGEKEKYMMAVPLLDELAALDDKYEEQRNTFYYEGFFMTNNLSVRLECAAALPGDYRDIAEQRARLVPYETFMAEWIREDTGETVQIFTDVYFKNDVVYGARYMEYYRVNEDNQVSYRSTAGSTSDLSVYTFGQTEMTEYVTKSGKTISYRRVEP